ncbi:MAG: flagellar hook capping FlgD N-terminal domain-containing protein [bacterium]
MQASRLFGSTIPTVASDTTSKTKDLDKDDFLKLLMTQMQNQDPLNPLDNTEFLSQLSQFSQLEQIFNVNQGIEGLASSQGSLRDAMLANLLGKTARVEASDVYLKDNNTIDFSYELENRTGRVTINIYDADSNSVRLIQESNLDSGQHQVNWDGKDQSGKKLPEGKYTIEITADNLGEDSWISPWMLGPVQEVIFSQGSDPLVRVNDQLVPISRIMQIGEQVPAVSNSSQS